MPTMLITLCISLFTVFQDKILTCDYYFTCNRLAPKKGAGKYEKNRTLYRKIIILHSLKTQKMKKLLLILLCCGTTLAYAQDSPNDVHSVKDSHRNILGFIMGGRITDAKNNFAGEFKMVDGANVIFNKDHQKIGYLVDGKEVQDADHKVLGHINYDGNTTYSYTITNAENKVVGHVKGDGTVLDASHNVIGYEIQTEVMWAAPYFFFFKFN